MNSNINPNSINSGFPVIDIDQPSQGFRDNFSAIKNNFTTASSEITNLQNTYIVVTGDVYSDTNNNQPLGQSSGVITLNLKLSGNNSNGSGGTFNSVTNNLSCTINPSGLLSDVSISDTGPYKSIDTSTIISSTKTTPDTNYSSYSSIESLTLPTITVDTFGNITSNSTTTIGNFNLFGYYFPNNGVLVGNSNNISTAIIPSQNKQVLYYNGTSLVFESISISDISDISIGDLASGDILLYDGTSWKPQPYNNGTVTDITAGDGLQITNSSTTPQISLNYGELSSLSTIAGSEQIAINNDNVYNTITTSQLLSYVSNNLDLSSLQTNNTKASTTSLIAYDTSLKETYKIPLSDFNNFDTTLIFVSTTGNDNTGDGSFINPYATINKAQSTITGNSHYNIVLFSGTYSENITITSNNISIYPLVDFSVTLTGTIICNFTTTNTLFSLYGLNISNTITLSGILNTILISNCNINNANTDTVITTGNISNLTIKDITIFGNINIGSTGVAYIENIYSSNFTNITISNDGTNSISNIINCGTITHSSGILYIDNIYNFYGLGGIISSSSNTSDLLSITNVSLKLLSNSSVDSFVTFQKTGTCSYVFENFETAMNTQQVIGGNSLSFKDNSWSYSQICTLNWPTEDSSGTVTTSTNIDINLYNKVNVISTYENCSITLPIPTEYNQNYMLELTVILIPTYNYRDVDSNNNPVSTETTVNDVTFTNVIWEPLTPFIDYTTGKQNIFKFVFWGTNSKWIGRRIDSPSILLDPDDSNILQTSTSGYIVKLDEVTMYVSSSSGNDTAGNGTQESPYASIRYAINSIKDNYKKINIMLKSGDTFDIITGASNYVENGTLAQILDSSIYLENKNINFSTYGDSTYTTAQSTSGVNPNSVLIGTQAIIEFTYSKYSDQTTMYGSPGFIIDGGKISFEQINIKINSTNLPTSNTIASWSSPFTIYSGNCYFGGCDFTLSNGVIFGGVNTNESEGSIIISNPNFDVTGGTAFIDATQGLQIKAPFSDNTTSNSILINGADTGLKTKITNFNSSVANTNSFIGIVIVNGDNRVYEGVITQNLITTSS